MYIVFIRFQFLKLQNKDYCFSSYVIDKVIVTSDFSGKICNDKFVRISILGERCYPPPKQLYVLA